LATWGRRFQSRVIVSAVTPAANLSCRLYSLPSAASIPSGGEQTRKGTGDNGNVHGLGQLAKPAKQGTVDDVAEGMGQRFWVMFSANARHEIVNPISGVADRCLHSRSVTQANASHRGIVATVDRCGNLGMAGW
jgi:hypothetical protein